MSNKAILIVSSELLFAQILSYYLTIKGYSTIVCEPNINLKTKIIENNPSIIIAKDVDITTSTLSFLQTEFFEKKIIFFFQYFLFESLLKAFHYGVKGYLLYNDEIENLLECLNSVQVDSYYVSPLIKNEILKEKESKEDSVLLSKREAEIVELIAKNLTNKEIADKLCISIYTVQDHRKHIRQKLQMKGGKTILIKYILAQTPSF